MALNTFVNITENEIAEVLEPLGFIKMDLQGTHEVVFSKRIEFEGLPTICRVYTGVLKRSGESRPAGEDAIRVCLCRLINRQIRVFKTLEKVRRIGTWARHLVDRIESIGTGLVEVKQQLTEEDLLAGRTEPLRVIPGHELECPKCGAPMVGPKSGRLGSFYGCSQYPSCRGLVNLCDAEKHLREELVERK